MSTRPTLHTIFEALVMVSLLVLAMADVNAQQSSESTPLLQSAYENRYVIGKNMQVSSEVNGYLSDSGRQIMSEKNIRDDAHDITVLLLAIVFVTSLVLVLLARYPTVLILKMAIAIAILVIVQFLAMAGGLALLLGILASLTAQLLQPFRINATEF